MQIFSKKNYFITQARDFSNDLVFSHLNIILKLLNQLYVLSKYCIDYVIKVTFIE